MDALVGGVRLAVRVGKAGVHCDAVAGGALGIAAALAARAACGVGRCLRTACGGVAGFAGSSVAGVVGGSAAGSAGALRIRSRAAAGGSPLAICLAGLVGGGTGAGLGLRLLFALVVEVGAVPHVHLAVVVLEAHRGGKAYQVGKAFLGAGERVGHGELVYPRVRGGAVVDGVGIAAVFAKQRFALVHVAGDLQLLEAVVYRPHIKRGAVPADGNREMGKLLNAFVGLAGLLVYIVGVVGQGSQGVVHLRQRPLGVLFEPYAVRGAFAGVGALRMGRPACGGAGHAVLVGYQRVRFPGCARGDGEGHVGQALHAAVLRLGEGKVAADHLLA